MVAPRTITEEAEFKAFRGTPLERELRELAETEGITLDEINASSGILHTLVYVKVTGEVAMVRDFMKTAMAIEDEFSRIDLRQR
jgi:predicted RNA-binding protein